MGNSSIRVLTRYLIIIINFTYCKLITDSKHVYIEKTKIFINMYAAATNQNVVFALIVTLTLKHYEICKKNSNEILTEFD